MEDNLSYSSCSLVNNDVWLIVFSLKLQGADNGSDSVNPAESWNFFRKRGGKSSKGKKEKHNKENSKVLEIPLSKYWNMSIGNFSLAPVSWGKILPRQFRKCGAPTEF